MAVKNWWENGMNRVIQYNLQVKDTPGMDAKRLAAQTKELGGNVVVLNVGGIYAWYKSKVPFHHINEYLPESHDLLMEMIKEFHALDIEFVARFDFSITDDTTYLQKPEWFARHIDKTPFYRGEKRMGNWSLLLNTCATGGYRNEEVAIPVLKEVINEYDIDGIFLNAPFANLCYCERCQRKYQELFGTPIPESIDEIDSNWLSICTKDNIALYYETIKAERSDLPLILYYAPFYDESKAFGRIHRDNIYDRYATADLICTEAQNILSNGLQNLPETIRPTMVMKAGQAEEKGLLPFGIIHSSPGMDWRHVGLPATEYLPWMCQIPAANGTIWHSITGYPETVYDKRILKKISEVNKMISATESYMESAKSFAQVLLFWDGGVDARKWAEILAKNHISFDLMHDYNIDKRRVMKYAILIIPQSLVRYIVNIKSIIDSYTTDGGIVIAESIDEKIVSHYSRVFGIEQDLVVGEYLTASYMDLREAPDALKRGFDTDRLAFRGKVMYGKPRPSAIPLATLIPPFAPLEVVGAPPERASIPVECTSIPLCYLNSYQNGKIVFFPFLISDLATAYGLSDHYEFINNLFTFLLREKRSFTANVPSDVIISCYKTETNILVHLVNEVGVRPLMDTIPIHDISLNLAIEESMLVTGVESVIGKEKVSFVLKDRYLEISLPELKVWDMIAINYKMKEN
jgi:hypothetical protein